MMTKTMFKRLNRYKSHGKLEKPRNININISLKEDKKDSSEESLESLRP